MRRVGRARPDDRVLAGSPEALVACDEQLYRGARAEAAACYRGLLAESTDARIKGDAARATGDVRAANASSRPRSRSTRGSGVAHALGRAVLATHQNNEAIKLFQEALEIDAAYAPAKIGLAKIAADRYEEKTREWAEQVIKETPDQALEAHLMLARAALEDGAIETGEKALDAALELAEDHDRSPLEIYALKAAVDLLRGTTDSRGRSVHWP